MSNETESEKVFTVRQVSERQLILDGQPIDFLIDEDDRVITLPASMQAARAFKAGVYFARSCRTFKVRA